MSAAERPETTWAKMDRLSTEELLAALSDSDILQTLGITTDDLVLAHTDSDLLATLRITYEFLVVLRETSVLDVFYALPRTDQTNFLRWIGTTDDDGLRSSRTNTLVSALAASPLGDSAKTRDHIRTRGI